MVPSSYATPLGREASALRSLLLLPVPQGVSRLTDNGEGGFAARRFPLFKISLALPHLVRHVGKADDLVLSGLRQRVEGGGLHLHRQDALCAALCNHGLCFPERRIGRPARSNVKRNRAVVPKCADYLAQGRVERAVGSWWHIMVARALVAQGFVNEDHVRGLTHWEDL